MPKHWNCFVAGCTSNFSSKISDLKYYRIPKKLRNWYDAFFKTDCVNWENAVICSLHWRKQRKSPKDLPDIRLPGLEKTSSAKKRKSPYERSAKRASKARRSLDIQLQAKDNLRVATAKKQEQESAILLLKQELVNAMKMNKLLDAKNNELLMKNEELHSQVAVLKVANDELKETLKTLKLELKKKTFDCANIDDNRFKYLCGLDKDVFFTVYNCFQPFIHLIIYEGCKTNKCQRRSLSKDNELFACLVICRHAIHLGIMSWFLNISESSMSRIFEAWMTFGHAIFNKLNLIHPKNLVEKMMPTAYKNLEFSHIVLVIDATEFKITGFTDLQLNQLFFSDYKNSHTVKALPCLTPHGAACLIPPLYPGSVTDTTLTDLVGALDDMICHDGVLTDKGFAISELAAKKGAVHNRPPMKSTEQFTTGECDENFKIACLRIHIERWIGCVRDFAILNTVWPSSRIDLLNSVWIFIANLVNIVQRVGPKE